MQRFRHRALVAFLVPLLIVAVAGCASQPVRQSWVVDYKYVDFDPFPGMNVHRASPAFSSSRRST